MTRFIMSIILIGLSVATFLMFSRPFYNDITTLRAQAASYDEALANSEALENERDKLTAKDSAIDPEDKIRLQKLLPDTVDNIRLILEIEELAVPYGMALRDVQYSPVSESEDGSASGGATAVQSGVARQTNQGYGSWDLEFSTTGSYNNFLNFLADLEKNLRMVDISSINFSSTTMPSSGGGTASAPAGTPSASDIYKYDFKIKTYWLKN